MIINDNGRTYDSEFILTVANKDKSERNSYERDQLREFARLAYLRYTNIRSITSGNRCKKIKPEQVLEQLDVNKIQQHYDWSKEEIIFYIKFAKDYISIVG